MLRTLVATKLGMSQAWTTTGKRLAVTRCRVDNNVIVGQQPTVTSKTKNIQELVFEVGYGTRKIENMDKPLKMKLNKSGFSVGVAGITGIRVEGNQEEMPELKVGATLNIQDVLSVGDVVAVQGTSKGRGFAGGIKRHGFSGGPKTHGQSDRERAVGSIGAGTTPGKVWKGKKMPGHYGVDTKSVSGLVVLHIDPETQEVWLSGPVPGHTASFVKITKTGQTKTVELNKDASGIVEKPVAAEETTADAVEAPAAEAQEAPQQAAETVTEEQK